jgi:hypothetical protein
VESAELHASYAKSLSPIRTGWNRGCGKPKVEWLSGEGSDNCLQGDMETSEIA